VNTLSTPPKREKQQTMAAIVNSHREQVLDTAMQRVQALEKMEVDLCELQDECNLLITELAGLCSDIYARVCAEIDLKGKPIFSNDGARKAEANVRENDDTYVQDLRKHIRLAEREIAMKRIAISSVERQVNLARAYLHGND
jgi:hypothetical protein